VDLYAMRWLDYVGAQCEVKCTLFTVETRMHNEMDMCWRLSGS